ncbi:MAG: hypothetical protein HN712_06025 [Gemmatimonadetes bacterium]|jgi:lysophospholipase L1-like esterase|nr:hypothetical protein [Gemmatimonadota bacterium]MBT6146324.1 hypothetical protein [Gemmatimonadota bacterium]MBT7859849.1 hypothetical protein [Gemmatimonadota bacterium]
MAALSWHDVSEWEIEGKGWTDTARRYERLPARAEGVVREPVWDLSRASAGLCLRFVTDAEQIHARYDLHQSTLSLVHMPATGHSGLDLYAEDAAGDLRWVGITQPTAPHVEGPMAQGLAPGLRQYTLYLPLYNSPETLELGVEEGAHIEPLPARTEKSILFYGTSIMHGACASRPGMAIPAILGRRLRRPTINLGFAGNGVMEPEIANLLSELDPCLFIADCLPNMTASQVTERAAELVRRIRQTRPLTPILLVEDRTYANTRFFPAKADRHRTSRAALRTVWQELTDGGDERIHYLDGDHLLPGDGEATVDSSHPTDLGMVAYADAYEAAIRPILRQS